MWKTLMAYARNAAYGTVQFVVPMIEAYVKNVVTAMSSWEISVLIPALLDTLETMLITAKNVLLDVRIVEMNYIVIDARILSFLILKDNVLTLVAREKF